MSMTALDWSIVLVVLGVMVAGVLLSRSYMKSVADFLAAGRTAGRYLISMAQGIAGLGAITIVGLLEMNYIAGFSMTWWGFTMSVVILIITVSGWVIYRFRQTRALTLAQFFEKRYSRNFRVFAGVIAFLSGIINFGIFPAVGARFFIHFCGLPATFAVFGLAVPTFPAVMIVLLAIALFFVFSGGQVAVIITDFAQGLFVNVVFVVIVLYLFLQIDWTQIIEALLAAPQQASLINPFKTSHIEDFNFWYFLIGIVGVLYGAMSWQGTQAYNSSAKSAHEAKMGSVLGNWRGFPQGLFLLFVPIIIYTVMHHPDFSQLQAAVDGVLAGVGNEAIQSQMRGPLVLRQLLPVGLMGAFAAVMLAAFISTHDTYLHSWGSIFIQDVVMPFRTKRLSERQHIRALRWSILGVAVFIFCFSLLFQQSEYIFLFFAITGAIFAGGSGAVIIGGLYWKRGTAPAAWTALITGSVIAVGGILIHRLPETMFHAAPLELSAVGQRGWVILNWLYSINGQQYWAVAMGASSVLYVIVSLLGRRRVYDLDRLLNRGKYAVAGETEIANAAPSRGLRILGMGREFTRADRIIYIATYAHTAVWTVVFVFGTVHNLRNDVPDTAWAQFWRVYFVIQVAISLFVLVWFALGGFRDIAAMLRRLRVMQRDETDDGMVESEAAGEVLSLGSGGAMPKVTEREGSS
jgi:SSS family solute:Na+ symporter